MDKSIDSSVIDLNFSPLLKPIDQGLTDPASALDLFIQLLSAVVELERRGVAPSMDIFYYQPLSHRLVVIPDLTYQRQKNQFYHTICDRYWNLLTSAKDSRYQELSSYVKSSRAYEGFILEKGRKLLPEDDVTLWLQRIPFVSVAFVFLMNMHRACVKSGFLQPAIHALLPQERGVAEVFISKSIPTLPVQDKPPVAQDSEKSKEYFLGFETERSEIDSGDEDTIQYFRNIYKEKFSFDLELGHALNSHGETVNIFVEGTGVGFFSKDTNVRKLLQLKNLILALHEKEYFHGLLCPSTIRQGPKGNYLLSLPVLVWQCVPMLFPLIPRKDIDFIAPEVRRVAETWEKPIEDINWKRADTYGLSVLITKYGLQALGSSPQLKALVKKGISPDWRERPSFIAILRALEK